MKRLCYCASGANAMIGFLHAIDGRIGMAVLCIAFAYVSWIIAEDCDE